MNGGRPRDLPEEAAPDAAPEAGLLEAAAMVFVEEPADPELGPSDRHHLLEVRRLRPGERVVACDGAGRWVPCRVAGGPRDRSVIEVDGEVRLSPRPRPPLTVAFAPAKGDRPEWVVQKLTELGVDRLVVVRTARTVVRWEGGRAARAAERLGRVAREAAAQSRRPWLPEVLGPLDLADLESAAGGPVALARPGGAAPSLEHPALAVGPEGGWDPSEVDRFPDAVALGPTVLRAETAAVVAGALLSALRSRLVGPAARPPLA